MSKHIINSLCENMYFQVTYFAPYVPVMQIIKNDCIIKLTDIQDDTFNMVLKAHFNKENAGEKIDEIKNIFHKKTLPFSWWVGPNDQPSNLKEILVSKGFHFKEYDYGMYLDLHNYSIKKPNKLEVKQVSTINDLKEFDNIHVKSFGNSKTFDVIFSNLPPSSYQGKSPFRFYTGYFQEKPVTTGVLVFHANVVGIYYIVTIPEERKKGYASDMMRYLLNIAKEENQKTAVLQASEDGKKVYEKIGFEKLCVFQEFVLSK